MTKKSAGRLLRDQQQKEFEQRLANEGIDENTCWEHLDGCYKNAKGLFVEYFNLATMVADPKTNCYFTAQEGEKVANLMKSLAVDTEPLQKETEALYAKHQGKVGIPENEDDNYLIISLQQDYGVLLNNHALTVLPVMLELDELLQKALSRRGRHEKAIKDAAAAAQAPTEQPVEVAPAPVSQAEQTPTAATYAA